MFCALVQTRVEQLSSDYESMDKDLKDMFLQLQSNPSAALLESIVTHPKFQNLFEGIMQESEGTDCQMSVAYIKDVSSLLAF